MKNAKDKKKKKELKKLYLLEIYAEEWEPDEHGAPVTGDQFLVKLDKRQKKILDETLREAADGDNSDLVHHWNWTEIQEETFENVQLVLESDYLPRGEEEDDES